MSKLFFNWIPSRSLTMEFGEQTMAHLKANSQNPKIQQIEDEKGLIIVKPNYNITSEISRVNYVDDSFVFPPGYRFCPQDEELIIHYLKKRVMNEHLPHDKIKEVNLYKYSPQDLSEKYPMLGDKEWYFFTPRDRKYPNGNRPNRAAGTGYWKATGADKPIKHNDAKVGFRKTLVFYEGKPPKGYKTNWIMHEFRVNESRRLKRHALDMRLDDWVLCRIYKKFDKSVKSVRKEHEQDVTSIGSSSIGKVENCDYEGTTDSYENATQNLKLPHHYDITFEVPGFDMDYSKYSLDNFSHFGPRSNYGMPLQPSFFPGNIFWDQKGYQENCNIFPMYFDVNNFYQDSYDEFQSQNILDSVLDENSSIYID